MTNGDKIRSLTDRELVRLISNATFKCYCCPLAMKNCCDDGKNCPNALLNWMKEEYKGETK